MPDAYTRLCTTLGLGAPTEKPRPVRGGMLHQSWRVNTAKGSYLFKKLQRAMATGAHYFLSALMIAIPLTGWLMSSAKGFQTSYFGILPIPDLLEKSEDLGETLALVHKTLNFTMMAIVFAHAAAALKHHFVDKDAILARMLPTSQK